MIDEWITYYKNFDIDKTLNRVLKNIEKKIQLYNKEQLEKKGIRSDNTQVQPPYTPLTVKIKRSKGQTTSHVTLQDKGDFYKGFYIMYQKDRFQLYSSDGKTQKLIKKYGENIFGLTDDNITAMIWADLYNALLNDINIDIRK